MRSNTLSTRIEEKLAISTRIGKECCMYKVHELLRDVNQKAYKPTLLAIGPYHHGNGGQGFMEEHKLRYLHQMLERTGGSVEAYIIKLRALEAPARKCYAECLSQYSSDEFVEMMLLDGCFIIELFRKYESHWEEGYREVDPIFEMKWVLPRIARDLLLFENQLPFFVLAILFEMSESNRSIHPGEHIIDIEKKDETRGESSISAAYQIIQTRLSDLALKFVSKFLPFECNVDALSNYNSAEKIKHLLCLANEAPSPSLPNMVCQRLMVGFRFKRASFDHLLGLMHTSICISLLDTEIDHAKERQEVGVKLKNAEIFKPLFGLICEPIIPLLAKMENMRNSISFTSEFQNLGFQVNIVEFEDWESIPYGSEFKEAGVEFTMAKKFKDDVYEIFGWITIPYAVELQEAGIEFDKAKKFKFLLAHRNRNEDQKSKLRLYKIENWKSIPYGKELREAGVEFKKAKKFKRLLAYGETETDPWHIHGPTATELVEAGVRFKKADKYDMFSMKFNNGLMEISPLRIDDQAETYLRNLIAYEQYCDRDDGFTYVSNYVRFMDDLINTTKDVELLRQRGIIHNCLGDDTVISTMVNKFCDHIDFSSTNSIARTSIDAKMYCRRSRNVWMAKLRRDYFNSPWAWISFLAAFLLLALTVTQTIFSIIP